MTRLFQKDRAAAVITIRDGAKMTRRGVKDVAKWLRKQANWFECHSGTLSPTFRARYIYTERR